MSDVGAETSNSPLCMSYFGWDYVIATRLGIIALDTFFRSFQIIVIFYEKDDHARLVVCANNALITAAPLATSYNASLFVCPFSSS